MMIVADLWTAGGIGGIVPVTGNIDQHAGDELVDAGVGFNQVSKFLQNGMQLMGSFAVDVSDDAA